MAIGLSNVETRKVKKSTSKKTEAAKATVKSRMATTLIENSAQALETFTNPQAVSVSSVTVAAPIKERKDRISSSGEINSLWLDWSNRVAGAESANLALLAAHRWMELERFVFDLVIENILPEIKKRVGRTTRFSQL